MIEHEEKTKCSWCPKFCSAGELHEDGLCDECHAENEAYEEMRIEEQMDVHKRTHPKFYANLVREAEETKEANKPKQIQIKKG